MFLPAALSPPSRGHGERGRSDYVSLSLLQRFLHSSKPAILQNVATPEGVTTGVGHRYRNRVHVPDKQKKKKRYCTISIFGTWHIEAVRSISAWKTRGCQRMEGKHVRHDSSKVRCFDVWKLSIRCQTLAITLPFLVHLLHMISRKHYHYSKYMMVCPSRWSSKRGIITIHLVHIVYSEWYYFTGGT